MKLPVCVPRCCARGGGTGALEQMIVADFMQNQYEAHVDDLKERLKAKRDVLIEALEENF